MELPKQCVIFQTIENQGLQLNLQAIKPANQFANDRYNSTQSVLCQKLNEEFI